MKMKQNNKPLVVVLGILIILIIVTIIGNKRKNSKTIDYSKMTDEEISESIQEEMNELTLKKLGDMGERDRMEYYVSSFINAVENKQYDEAYDMLYDDFKKNYFPLYTNFEEYAKTTFPSTISIEHTNIERNGSVYVLWVKIADPLAGKSSEKEINFVVQENNLNDFVLSFSVNTPDAAPQAQETQEN